jgi:hypothetical protein
MKQLIKHPLTVAILSAALALSAQAGPSAGQVDFGSFTAPADGGEFVEVQIKTNLISLAAKLVEKEQPQAAKLLRSVQLVRVNVIGLSEENREEMTKRIQKIRSDLDAKGWERNVNVREKNGEDVGVYTRTRGDEAFEGLVVTVIDSNEAVLINIVGDIRPEQIVELGESLNIKPLKDLKDVIKK